MPKRPAPFYSPGENSGLIGHVRICGRGGRVTAAPTRLFCYLAGGKRTVSPFFAPFFAAKPPQCVRAETVLAVPRRKVSEKSGALSDHPRLIRRCGVTPLMYQYGEKVIFPTKEMARTRLRRSLGCPRKNRHATVASKLRPEFIPHFLHGGLFFAMSGRSN